MSLRKLPKIEASNLPKVCAFQPDEDALDRWNAALSPKAASENNTISILDVIGEDFFGEGVTARRISAALRSIGDREVCVDINSPGGDFFEGVAIYNALRAHPQKVTVRILGLAASAASVIAMAGDEIQIGKAGFLMIHNAWVVAIGNRHDLAEAAATIEPFDDAMATVYSDRAGVSKEQAAEWMDAETWFNGEQAVDAGLADGFLPADAVAEDANRAQAALGQKSIKKIEASLAKSGLSRDERRSLIGDAMAGSAVADRNRPAVAGDEVAGLLASLRETITS